VPKFLIDDHSFQVLKSFQPFLGERGNGYVTVLESLQELLSSEPAQKTLQSFRIFGIDPKFNSMEVVAESAANPFNLFLILILLLVADLPGGAGLHASAYDMEPVIPVQFA
jgi:hypothetical protein